MGGEKGDQAPHKPAGGLACDHCGIALLKAPYTENGGIFCCRRCALRARALRHAFKQLEWSYLMTVEALAAALDARDPHTHGHSRRVTAYAVAIARALGLRRRQVRVVRWAGTLHDIGKIGVPDAILRKPGPLSEEEWAAMRRHPELAVDILGRAPFLAEALPFILHHHERWDGCGYPYGLAGEQIPPGARILAVADALDTIATDRPYRKGRGLGAAIAEVAGHAGSQFDPGVVEALLAAYVRVSKRLTRTPAEDGYPSGQSRNNCLFTDVRTSGVGIDLRRRR